MADRNALSFADGALVVRPRGMDRVWGFRRQVVVPLEQIAEVQIERSPLRVPTGWRGPGLDAGWKLSGTFHPKGERHYWNYSGRGAALTVKISGAHAFQRLYLAVEDPEAACELIREAVAAHRAAG